MNKFKRVSSRNSLLLLLLALNLAICAAAHDQIVHENITRNAESSAREYSSDYVIFLQAAAPPDGSDRRFGSHRAHFS